MTKYIYYEKMKMIRMFENLVLELFSNNEISGTTHTCIGQENVAVAAMENIVEGDVVFSNHRCHGHYLAYGGPVEGLLAEIMSKENGVCGGRGGSQHLHYKNFFTNGIQGGIVPNAAGMAWANKIRNEESIGMVFLGDGTLGQGVVYETMNLSSLYKIPILYVIENNHYAMTTKVEEGVSGSIVKRPEAFGIYTYYTKNQDVEILSEEFGEIQNYVRSNKKPACIVVDTYRLGAHSKGDDTRDKQELEEHWKNDPLLKLRKKLASEEVEKIDKRIEQCLQEVLEKVKRSDSARMPEREERRYHKLSSVEMINTRKQKCLEQINMIFKDIMAEKKELIMLGEDICDNYGGAFKVTKGLSSKFGNRVVNTPISEAGFTGMAVGLAMNGMVPVVEMMFGDFSTLVFDQIMNHATKYHWLYGKEVMVPMVLRVPMGGGRGYGPTHSQSLEKHFMGIPGLEIVALSPIHNNYNLYKYVIENIESPVMVVENKRMYGEMMLCMENNRLGKFDVKNIWNDKYPTIYLSLDVDTKPDVLVFAYGEMTRIVLDAAIKLMIEDEIQVDVAILSQVYPVAERDIATIIPGIERIVTVEEGALDAGWGSEIIAHVSSRYNVIKNKRVAADNTPIANGKHLEEQQSVNLEKIIQTIRGVFYEK